MTGKELVKRVADEIARPLANMQGGCFLPAGRTRRGDCADGDCYCTRVSRHCARAAIGAIGAAARMTREDLLSVGDVLMDEADACAGNKDLRESLIKCAGLIRAIMDLNP